MVLFPFALLFLIGVIVWVIRNEGAPEEQDEARLWPRLRPRPPRNPPRGRPHGSRDRAGAQRGSSAETRDPH
jgi:hypothetical protein